MRLWRFRDPNDEQFAHASRLGSWSRSTGVCPSCGASSQTRVKPLLLEWEPGSSLVGDFNVAGFDSDIAVTTRVIEDLISFGGFEAGPVEVATVSTKKSGKPSRSKSPRVALPYEGPTLNELWVTRSVQLDRKRSSLRIVSHCHSCGRRSYEVSGIEKRQSRWDPSRLAMVWDRIPREAQKGIFVAESEIVGGEIFRVVEFPSWVLCTDRVRGAITQAGHTNVAFDEVGEMF